MRAHGITANTPSRLVLDSGALFINYGLAGEEALGATRGGAVWTLEQNIREIPVDGALGPVKNLERKTRAAPMISGTLLEFGLTRLKQLIVGSASTPSGSYDVITRDRDILASDYLTNVALVAQVSNLNNWVVLIVQNALLTANFALTTVDKDEATMPFQVRGHYDPSDLDTEPWEIRWPQS